METVEAGLGAVSPEELAEISGKGKDGAATELEEMIMNAKKKDEQTEETTERMNAKEKGECMNFYGYYSCVSESQSFSSDFHHF